MTIFFNDNITSFPKASRRIALLLGKYTSQINNRENYNNAVTRMGADDINTKVWWEK